MLTLIVTGFVLVPSSTAVSPAPGTLAPDQLAAVFQLLPMPRPVQVRVAPRAGGGEARITAVAQTATATARTRMPTRLRRGASAEIRVESSRRAPVRWPGVEAASRDFCHWPRSPVRRLASARQAASGYQASVMARDRSAAGPGLTVDTPRCRTLTRIRAAREAYAQRRGQSPQTRVSAIAVTTTTRGRDECLCALMIASKAPPSDVVGQICKGRKSDPDSRPSKRGQPKA